MVSEILTPVIWKVAPSLLTAAAKHGIKKLFEASPVARAIQSTAQAFPHFENLSEALTSWSTSERFLDLLQSLKAGERNLTDGIIVAAFIETGGFYAADQTEPAAREILTTFLEKIEEEIYGSPAGLSAHAGREEILHEQTRTEVRDVGRTLTAEMKRLELLIQRVTPDDTVSKSQLQEQVLHAKVDEARDLLAEGKATAARWILERLRQDPGAHSFSEELQFRIATNLGACDQRLGDEEAAKDEFRAALRYQPEKATALANAAAAELLDGNFEEAVRLSAKARQLKERDAHATSIYLQGLHGAGRGKEIKAILEEEAWIRDDALCTLTLGSLSYKDEQYEQAEKLLRIAIEQDPKESQAYLLLSQAIFIPLQTSLREDPPLPWQLPEPMASRAREAEELLTRAIGVLERQENRSRLRTALVNRAAIRLMLGMFAEVLLDCDRVLVEDQTDNIALRNKGIALLQLDRATEAADCLERITDPEERSNIILILAVAYGQAEEHEKVVKTLSPVWSRDAQARQQIDNGDMLASAYMKLGKPKEAAEVVRQLAERWPGDPDALAAMARQRHREGKLEEAGSLLREALSYSRDHQRQHISLQLADLHYEQGNYSEAAALYAPLVETDTNGPILQRYLISLFNAGLYREALTLAQKLRVDRPAVPTVTEIEARILEHIGDLEAARSLRIRLNEVEPKKVSHRVQLALLEIRRGERERAKGILSEIRFEDIKHNAQVLMQVAQARVMIGMGDILPLAYRARQIAFGDPDIHFAYVGLFLRREDVDRSSLEPNEVGVDCTVHLKRNGETRRFTILDEASVNRDRDELALTDPLAVKLLGKRKGDEVVLKDNPFERLAYEVVDVQSKYVFAFQETISGFTTWFPDHPALQRVEFKLGDSSKIKTLLDARQRRTSEAQRLYRQHNLTLGAFARIIGSRPIEVWAGMMSDPEGIVIASTGGIEDCRKEAELLTGVQELVADLTGLLTFEYIGLLNHLVVGFRRIIVPQAVLDEINETLTERFFGPKPAMNLWKEGDQYLHREITAESQKRGQDFLERIRSFVESSAEIVPASGMLDFEKTKFDELGNILGHDAIATVLVARERKLPLFSDDLGLRRLARNDWQVEGVWSQTILVSLRDRGVITKEDYCEAIRKLGLGNYYFVSINADDVMWVLDRSHMEPSYEVSRILSLLEGPDCSEDSAIRIIADVIRKVWLEPTILYNQKLWVLDLALGALTKGRMARGVIERLKAALRVRFALMPLPLPVIFRRIDLWSQQRVVEGNTIE